MAPTTSSAQALPRPTFPQGFQRVLLLEMAMDGKTRAFLEKDLGLQVVQLPCITEVEQMIPSLRGIGFIVTEAYLPLAAQSGIATPARAIVDAARVHNPNVQAIYTIPRGVQDTESLHGQMVLRRPYAMRELQTMLEYGAHGLWPTGH